MRTTALLNAVTAPAAAPAVELAVVSKQQQHSPWHSPVPYLFGGLAAMLGLIAFALLILACSYWKLFGHLDGGNINGGEGNGDPESGDGKPADACKARPQYLEETIVVIMAGDEKPTFLATPISSRASSFGDNNKSKGGDDENKKEDEMKESDADSEAAQDRRRNQEESHLQNQDQNQTQEQSHQNQSQVESYQTQN